ncbi:hypothetical protein ERICIV_03670 [Paenibacillus larvae subsp. larvae]|uniref:Uncharacterized protein n=2 Tax=Paenibacillus larvae TaxID=1464 RepID=A0A2L1U555_9BACL|nr:hypothetical protein [Paenibacillus larvae]AQZ46345.1 hypothetical protein B5S25_06580 [Paenibacillus larvae subsp. pulvifaciens]AVF28031.1 hypothetical protein ERICIII_03927 [Paenibacillus larvae subsp. larvae]AVF32534.1 hypothetical protein ERICIV_03670 [Paenibacillus larvae subsp. larvae]MBH0344100.1 hypothetical protein [Paenibacillus larvae]MCY7519095.1 hypothetical protein [Paenibacillus larvae]
MSKRSWTSQELDRLIVLSKDCPPAVIAKELERPVTSVRKKMREIGVTYVKGDEWKRKQIQMLISSDQAPVSSSTTKIGKKEETYPESAVLDEFWTTLLRMARVAKKRGKRVDVLSFIDTYRKIRTGG